MSFPPPPTDAPASEHRGHHSRGDRDRGHYQGTTDGRRHFTADAPRGDGQLHARPYGEMMRPSTSSRRDFSRDDRRDVARDDRRDFPRDDRRSEYRRGGELDTGSSGLEPSRHVTMHAVPGPGQNQHPEQPPPLPTIRIGGVLPGSIPPPPPLPPVQAPAYATTPTAPPALVPHRPNHHDHHQQRSGDGDAAVGADRRHERHARDREARRSSRDERGDRDRDGSRRKRSSRKTRSYSSSVSTSSRSVSGSSRGSFSSDDSYARRREKRHRRDAKDKSRREKRDKYRSDRKHRSSRHRRSISSESSYTSDSASSVTSTSSYSSESDRRRSRRHRSSGKSSSRRTRESRTERTKAHDRTSRRDRSDAATIVDRGDGPAAPHQQPPRSVPHGADGADRRRVEQQAFRLDDAAPAVPPPHTAVVAASGTAQQLVATSREDERREQRRREKEAERQQRELDKQRKRRQREAEEARRKKEKALRHKRRHAASFSGSDVSGDEDDDTAGDVSSSSVSESDASSRSDVSEADYDLPPTAGGGSEAFWAGFGHGTEESAAAAGAPSAAAGAAAAAASAGHANDDEAFIPREPTEQELAAHSKMLTARLRLQPGEELPSAAELADVDDGTSLTIALQITRLRRADAVGPHATATEPDTPLTPYLIYHMLRNDGFPRKIVMMVPKSIAAPRIDDDPEGGAGLIDKEYQGYHLHSLRCLVEVDSVDSKRRLLYRFGRAATPNSPPGVVLRVSETTSFVVTAMPCPPGTKVYAHVNNPTTLVVTQACVHMLGPVWPRHFFRPRGATGIAETPHDGPFMQFKGPIRIALPSPGASSLPGNYTPRSAMLSPNDGMHGGSRMRRANDGMMLSAGGGGGGGGSHGTPRGLGPRVDPRDRPYPSPSMGASLASVGSVGRSPHLHSDSRGGLSSYDAAPMDGASSRPPRRHDYPSSDFDAPDGRRGEVRGRGFDRPDRPASQHHTSHRHHHQDGPHPPPQQQQQSPYGRFGGDDFPRHPERLPRGPDRRDYPGEGGLLIPTVRVGPRPVDAHGMPSSAASHPLSAHGGSVGGGDHFERPERYREGEAERFGRSHRSGAPVGHLGDRRRERSPASYRTGGAYPDRGHGGEGRDPDMHPTNHRGRGELPGAIGAREFHRGPRDAPMGRTRHDGGHERRHHYESGSSHGDMAAAHRLPSWSQQQHQQLQQHPLRSPIDAQLAPGDAQHHHPRPGTAHSREESTIRGEDIYSF